MKNKVYALFSILILLACNSPQPESNTHLVEDMLGRKVRIPDKVNRIICINAGSLRLVSYLNAIDKVVGIEEIETRSEKPYNLAHPELSDLPIIGPMHGGDAELIASHHPDIIISTYTSSGDAEKLQLKTGIPVIALYYGDLGSGKSTFYSSLITLGKALGKREKADSIINFFENQISILNNLTNDSLLHKPSAYVGGISYRGAHGLGSTDPEYPPFKFVNTTNLASEIDINIENAFIDLEQLISWNPEYLFIDYAGLAIIRKEMKDHWNVLKSLQAIENKNIYAILPHNYYATNFGTVLCNAYYIGKILHPEKFEDKSINSIAESIYYELHGNRDIYSQLSKIYGSYQNIQTESLR